MKKLEDIPKKNIFEVPEGYFEKLPGIIQSRVAKPDPTPWFAPTWKFALPILAFIAVGIIWFTSQTGDSIEQQLASIQTEQLIAYLDDGDLTMDDLAETVTWSETDLDELEEKVFSTIEVSGDELDILLEEFSVEPGDF
ncbi:MAG TPA: hypothetical protein PKJ83_05445 [Cyclobacteriaceae bacterium]|nr:hypothetical protein [Cyclobacteriaceae bacterium]HPW63923.1 hypothetical protein [Cyclobacteriaceae bacterium]